MAYEKSKTNPDGRDKGGFVLLGRKQQSDITAISNLTCFHWHATYIASISKEVRNISMKNP